MPLASTMNVLVLNLLSPLRAAQATRTIIRMSTRSPQCPFSHCAGIQSLTVLFVLRLRTLSTKKSTLLGMSLRGVGCGMESKLGEAVKWHTKVVTQAEASSSSSNCVRCQGKRSRGRAVCLSCSSTRFGTEPPPPTGAAGCSKYNNTTHKLDVGKDHNKTHNQATVSNCCRRIAWPCRGNRMALHKPFRRPHSLRAQHRWESPRLCSLELLSAVLPIGAGASLSRKRVIRTLGWRRVRGGGGGGKPDGQFAASVARYS